MIRRERRGPYKKYLLPGNEAAVPKKTIQYNGRTHFNDRPTSPGGSESELGRPNVAITNHVSVAYPQPSTSRSRAQTSVAVEAEIHVETESENGIYDHDMSDNDLLYNSSEEQLNTNVDETGSENEPLSDLDLSDDETTTAFNGTESLDDESTFEISPELNDIVGGQCNMSKFEILLLLLTYSIRHSLTTVAIIDLLKLINTVIGRNVLPQTKYWFSKIFYGGITFTYHIFCPTCMSYIGPVPNGEKSDYMVPCPSCHDRIVEYSINNDNPTVFITISMTDQLKTLLETRKDIQNNLDFRNQRVKETGRMKDILDGLAYQKLTEENRILSDDNNFSVTFNTDGAPVFKSSKCSIWPLQFLLNELSPKIRFEPDNILLGGLWFGNKEPRMDLFMIPFVQEALKLEEHGLTWIKSSGEKVLSKFVFLCCCLDSVARPMIQGIKQFNGYFGCAYCLHPGENVEGSKVRFTNSHPSPKERTNKTLRKDMKNLAENGLNTDINGVKSVSLLIVLPNFDLVFGFVLDYMHCILLGVSRFMANLWLDSTNHDRPFYIGLSVDVIDRRLMKIAPPSTASRNPRPISQRCHWKANEWRNWLLYYSLPCLKGVLPNSYFNHFAMLVGAVFVVLQEDISFEEIDLINHLLYDFVFQFEEMYGKVNMTYNVHLLRHVGKHVSLWGPLWAYSAFVFESGNHTLLKLIKGTTNVGSQIAMKYLRYSSIPRLIANYDVQNSTIKMCSEIMSLPLTRKIARVDDVCLLGLPENEALSGEEIIAFTNLHSTPTTSYYKRVIFQKVKYSCEMYKRQKKNCDFIAYLNCHAFVKIRRFVVVNGTTNILCQEIRTLRNVSGVETCHIKLCRPGSDAFGSVCLKPISMVCGQGLLMEVDNLKYVSIFPKFLEKD